MRIGKAVSKIIYVYFHYQSQLNVLINVVKIYGDLM